MLILSQIEVDEEGSGDEEGLGDEGGDSELPERRDPPEGKGREQCVRGGGKLKRKRGDLEGRKDGLPTLASTSSLSLGPLMPENQPLSDNGTLLLDKICLASRSLENQQSNISSLIHSALQTLVQGQQNVFYPRSINMSLETLRQNCETSERLETCSGLIHILALIWYRVQIERY